MSDDATHDVSTDRYAYSRRALSRLVLSFEQRDLAERAAAGVPTDDTYAHPGELVEEAQTLVELAQQVLRWAVIHERQKGTSWEEIGQRLGGITRQSAHERYKDAVDEWQFSLVQPYEPGTAASPYPAPVLHEAALEPTATGARLDAWAREHVPSARGTEHPVTGHLPPLTTVEEMNQVLAAIQHLTAHGASPAERAAVYERKAALLERIAAEDGRPEAAEQAADARARAARLREEGRQPGAGG
ncbi:hypothetical protein [Streptomyces sp. NRRL S-1022]|uniref:hypothetical protein n=1 Tax=Streptomyces sp. NRRL S-1022 TaxID=1463880 RepID=UPI0004BF6AB2|nr:hypothetical protein [Streptomyces sp. NRRL S-1022]